MKNDERHIKINKSIHSIKGYLSPVATLLELENSPQVSADQRLRLIAAAERSMNLISKELDDMDKMLMESK